MALSKAELEKTETALKAAFKAFDNDNGTGDGFISKEEMKNILTRESTKDLSVAKDCHMSDSIAERKWAAWLKAFDANGDGALAVAEIAAALAHKEEVDRLYAILRHKSTTNYDGEIGRDFPWYNSKMHGADWTEVVKKLLDSLKTVGGGKFLEAILTDVDLCVDLFNHGDDKFYTPFGALLDADFNSPLIDRSDVLPKPLWRSSLLAGSGAKTVMVDTWEFVKGNTRKKKPATVKKDGPTTECPILGFDDAKVRDVAKVLKSMMDCVRTKKALFYNDATRQIVVHNKVLGKEVGVKDENKSLLACAAFTLNYDLVKTVYDEFVKTSPVDWLIQGISKGAMTALSVSVNNHETKIPGRDATALRGVAKMLPDDPTITLESSGLTQQGEVKDFLVLDDTAAAKKLFGEDLSQACLIITTRPQPRNPAVDMFNKYYLVAFAFNDLERIKKLEHLAKITTVWEQVPKISNVYGK